METYYVFEFHGEVDSSRNDWVSFELNQIAKLSDGTPAIIDLSFVTLFDSTFFTTLTRFMSFLRETAPAKRIYIASKRETRIRKLLEMARFSQHAAMLDGLSETIADRVQNGSPQRGQRSSRQNASTIV